eukprot:430324-Pelagomonas_calceolata.AAC.2
MDRSPHHTYVHCFQVGYPQRSGANPQNQKLRHIGQQINVAVQLLYAPRLRLQQLLQSEQARRAASCWAGLELAMGAGMYALKDADQGKTEPGCSSKRSCKCSMHI